ncbi:Quino protein amine dehydrogenase [Myxozyma melibiosi]|uniref:Quino protein amine dehydrogenase n=1 Tax=Myxozyma melibiosi TaxID=54550 RepID=A0ABR1F2I4_9ASCO
MEFSEFIATTGKDLIRQIAPAVSYSGKYIATISTSSPAAALSASNTSKPLRSKSGNGTAAAQGTVQHELVIRGTRSLAVKRKIFMPLGFTPRFLKWYRPATLGLPADPEDSSSTSQIDDDVHRILAADEAGQVCVWDIDGILARTIVDEIEDLKSVVIIRQLDWGANVPVKAVDWGRSPDEILVFSDYNVAVAVWSIASRECVQLYHPKYTTHHGYSFQPGSRHLTVLSHPVADDVLSIYGGPLSNLQSLASFSLTDFYHAKGFKWSPDGRWIAVYDTITNFQVGVYTPLGALYRVFITTEIGLGVCDIEWSPAGNLLAVASYDGLIRCLNTWTFTPTVILKHQPTIQTKEPVVFVERPISSKEGFAKYERVLQYPVSPPKLKTSPTDAPPKTGFSIMAFNKDGTLLATKYDLIPTTLWIWSLRTLAPVAILVHVRKVKSAVWHPNKQHLLMITCATANAKDDESYENYNLADVGVENDCSIRIWNSEWRAPVAFAVPKVNSKGAFSNILEATWIRDDQQFVNSIDMDSTLDEDTKMGLRAKILISDRGAYSVGYLDDEQETEDDDTKVQRLIDGVQQQEWAEAMTTTCIDDTFANIAPRQRSIPT